MDPFTIDEEIQTGRYNTERGVIGSRSAYLPTTGMINKCNLFVDDMAKKYWGVTLPRRKHSLFATENNPDWPEMPMSAAPLHRYYETRSKLKTSGVEKVDHNQGREIANNGGLVLVLGGGHATIMSPSAAQWPLIYRSNLANRGGDFRTRVGIKSPEYYDYYAVQPEEYNKFNETIKKAGVSESALANRFMKAPGPIPGAFQSTSMGIWLIENPGRVALEQLYGRNI